MLIGAICGSLQAASSNSALLLAAGDAARADGDELVLFDALEDIPPLNPDVAESDQAASVRALRSLVESSNAVLIATPEYAHGVPGVLKNALDWLVGTGELYGKPVAILSAAPSRERAANARRDLARTLRAQGADVRSSRTIATRLHAGDPVDATVQRSLRAALRSLR
jgi:NAD(P)H-dependent FMN reductase